MNLGAHYPATPEGRDMTAQSPIGPNGPHLPPEDLVGALHDRVVQAPPDNITPPSQPTLASTLGKYGKFYAAIAGLVITVLVQRYAGSATSWLPYVVAAAVALGVYATPNTPPKNPAP